jgi:predicted aspartyl protease
MKNRSVHALTYNHKGIANCIITPVEVKNISNDVSIQSKGIWDTGATHSVITKSTAETLGLIPISMATVQGVHGRKEVNVYFVNITLNNKKITINAQVTECDELAEDKSVCMLLGMNVISMGDFSITNFEGNTTMSFRVPSLQRIDYVSGIKNGNQIIKDKIPGRNDPCHCGSGKKYKNCHGRM